MDRIRLHPSVILGPAATVKFFNTEGPSATASLEIGEGSHIFSTFNLLRPDSTIRIGARCQLGNSHFVCARSIEVGDDVVMAWGVTVADTDNHAIAWRHRRHDVARCRRDYVATNGFDLARSHDWGPVGVANVTIRDKAWIGFNVIILKGVTVGEGAVIGAGSVVTRDVEPWHVGAGNPFRQIRKLEASETDAFEDHEPSLDL